MNLRKRFDYPLDAIREIVINMIVHQDIGITQGVSLKFLTTILNFIIRGNSSVALPFMTFKEVGLIEHYGSGNYCPYNIFAKIMVTSSIFEEVTNGFRVTLFNGKLIIKEKIVVGERVSDLVRLIE